MKLTDADIHAIEALVDRGMADGLIGLKYGVSGATVGNFRRRHGIKSQAVPDRSKIKRNRNTRSIPAADKDVVRAMVERGLSDPIIAKEYDCSAAAVALYRKRHAIPVRLILTRPPEVKGVDVRFGRPLELGGYYDRELRHWVRVFEPMPAIGDMKPENENDEKRELEKSLHPGEGEAAGRPNYNPGWTNG